MTIKNTHSYEKSAGGAMQHYWTEQAEQLYTQLRIDDETDSVSFIMTAREEGMYTPTMRVELGVRMTYADLASLVAHAQEILKESGA